MARRSRSRALTASALTVPLCVAVLSAIPQRTGATPAPGGAVSEFSVQDLGFNLETNGPLKLKGATVDIQASATVNVKGSLINLG